METATAGKVTVELDPVPGFCVKSRATADVLIQQGELVVKQGSKIFVNITWDLNVPPPPPASEDTIRRSFTSLEIDDSSPQDWFVPIVLSDARQDSDKAGHPAIVFDCVLNPSIKSRALRDPGFKNFIIELAFQRIEAQTALILSRQISIPNIPSKGKPRARRVLVDASLYPPGRNHQPPPPLVQEISNNPTSVPGKIQPKGILKQPDTRIPAWSWAQWGPHIRILFDVPDITRALILESTLDVEPRRILFHVPDLYDFDLNLEALDSELSLLFGKSHTAEQALALKRMRSLDVDGAKAEWRAADKAIVLLV